MGRQIEYGHGIDSIQALVNALEGIRSRIQRSGKKWTWEGAEPGDSGFSRMLPSLFGLDFYNRLERILEREMAVFSRSAEERYRKRTPRRGRSKS
jgi:hypothetical protein